MFGDVNLPLDQAQIDEINMGLQPKIKLVDRLFSAKRCRGEKEHTKYRVKGQVYVLTVQVVKYLKAH